MGKHAEEDMTQRRRQARKKNTKTRRRTRPTKEKGEPEGGSSGNYRRLCCTLSLARSNASLTICSTSGVGWREGVFDTRRRLSDRLGLGLRLGRPRLPAAITAAAVAGRESVRLRRWRISGDGLRLTCLDTGPDAVVRGIAREPSAASRRVGAADDVTKPAAAVEDALMLAPNATVVVGGGERQPVRGWGCCSAAPLDAARASRCDGAGWA